MHMALTHPLRLSDHDMFMRFHGGGVGHLYMRQIKPWLDATGWGASWPLLRDRDPCPDQSPPQQEGRRAETDNEDGSSEDGNSDEDEAMSDMEEDAEEDPEQSEGSDEEGDEDEEDGRLAQVPSDGKSDNGEEGDHL